MKFDRELVIATDGFWAELASGDQALFLNGRDVPIGAKSDDRSVLCLRPLKVSDPLACSLWGRPTIYTYDE
jgi:hypothetical protein